MATLRELKGRIGSVVSSEKITGAMKMISSAKMHKSERSLRQLKPFRRQVETIFANILSSDAVVSSPLLENRDVANLCIVALGSDDGLCGAYNVNIFKSLQQIVTRRHQDFPQARVTLIVVGEKLYKAASKIKGATVEKADMVNSKSTGDIVNDYCITLQDAFVNAIYDRVELVYMRFESISRQRLTVSTLLPVALDDLTANGDKKNVSFRPYLFEPNASSIFATALPLYLMSVVQDVFIENQASEQAARVMAMQSANDNAKKLLEQLRLEYNKLRQQSITNELLDILGGQAK